MQFPVSFTKMSGTGNDFIIIDHRQHFIQKAEVQNFARAICRRKFSVGADGLILIEPSESADFSWTFLNGDGSFAEMCGNGARCAARFAFINGIAPAVMRFETVAGIIEAEVVDESVKIRMTAPNSVRFGLQAEIEGMTRELHFINTGVPHAIVFVKDFADIKVNEWGRIIRFHELFKPAGANANFVRIISDSHLHVRTYERGVEDETLACGTGAVAAAIIGAMLGHVKPPVQITTSGGEKLIIHFTVNKNQHEIHDVYLEGPAHFIYQGQLDAEAVRIS